MRKGGFPWPRRQTARFLRRICVRIQPTFWYGGERPAISVRAARRGETLLLTVADNGPGCAPSAGDRGLGLGLEVARRYARAYGGRLLAGSAPERGACFSLCLPLCPPGAAPSVPDYMADRFSPLYVQLAPVCDLPL